MNRKIEILAYILIWIGIAVFTIYSVLTGVERHEKMECERWIEMSKHLPDWYWTEWQIKQCQHYGYQIPENQQVRRAD